jgi:hypothetical protein
VGINHSGFILRPHQAESPGTEELRNLGIFLRSKEFTEFPNLLISRKKGSDRTAGATHSSLRKATLTPYSPLLTAPRK